MKFAANKSSYKCIQVYLNCTDDVDGADDAYVAKPHKHKCCVYVANVIKIKN